MSGLRSEILNGVATVTIDNPGKRNAMSAAMWRALPDLLAGLAKDPQVRVLVLTGTGAHFCAGADISELSVIDPQDDGRHLSVAAEAALAAFPKPTVAAIRGYCVGGGCQLANACDLRIAEDGGQFAITPAKIGIIYPPSAISRLVTLVGPASAKYLLYTADLVDAGHALRIGLVDEVVPDLDARLAALTATLLSRSQLTHEASKEIIDGLVAGTLTGDQVSGWLDAVSAGPDAAEGITAFLERRPPVFTWVRP